MPRPIPRSARKWRDSVHTVQERRPPPVHGLLRRLSRGAQRLVDISLGRLSGGNGIEGISNKGWHLGHHYLHGQDAPVARDPVRARRHLHRVDQGHRRDCAQRGPGVQMTGTPGAARRGTGTGRATAAAAWSPGWARSCPRCQGTAQGPSPPTSLSGLGARSSLRAVVMGSGRCHRPTRREPSPWVVRRWPSRGRADRGSLRSGAGPMQGAKFQVEGVRPTGSVSSSARAHRADPRAARARLGWDNGRKQPYSGGHCGLTRRDHSYRYSAGCGGDPLVIDDDPLEVVTDLHGGGQMNSIQGAQVPRLESTGGKKGGGAREHQRDRLSSVLDNLRSIPRRARGDRLGVEEMAGPDRILPRKPFSQARRFRFSCDELDKRRGIEVPHHGR